MDRLVELMSLRARTLFGLDGGRIAEGELADLVAVDLDAASVVDPSAIVSMGKATPFEGWSVCSRVRPTMVGGEVGDSDCRSENTIILTGSHCQRQWFWER